MYSTWVVLDLNLGCFCPPVVNFKLIKYKECANYIQISANYVQISANKVQNEVLMAIFLVSELRDSSAMRQKSEHFLGLTTDFMRLMT